MDTSISTIYRCIHEVIQFDNQPSRKYIRDICTVERINILKAIQTNDQPNLGRIEELCEPQNSQLENLEDLKMRTKELLEKYVQTMNTMFTSYEMIIEKIDNLNEIENEFFGLSCLDENTSEANSIKKSIDDYIRKKYQDSGIIENYKIFRSSYELWKYYRDVLMISQSCNDMSICSICTTEKINGVLIPCGHTFCISCMAKQKNHCFICRSIVKDRMKIFFS